MSTEPTIAIGDENEARIATQRQMQQAAARYSQYTIDAQKALPLQQQPVIPHTPPQVFQLPAMDLGPAPATNIYDHPVQMPYMQAANPPIESYLLLTDGKAVKMDGSSKSASWKVSNEAADALGQVLGTFHVRVVDLRDESDTDQP